MFHGLFTIREVTRLPSVTPVLTVASGLKTVSDQLMGSNPR